MEGYSVTEAASVLGVPTERVWELLARGVLSGAPEGEIGMRVYLQPRPAPAPPQATPSNGNGGGHEPEREVSPFRELLTEFRGLTERYGQALLALGEARGEVAALRSRVDLLEARIDLRLPPAQPASPPAAWTSTPMPFPAERAVVPTAPSEPLRDEAETQPDEHDSDEPHRARRRGPRRATESFAEALARAEDPSPPELRDATEPAAALAAARHASEASTDAELPRELPVADEVPVADEADTAEAEPVEVAEPEDAIVAQPEPVEMAEPELVETVQPEPVVAEPEPMIAEQEPATEPEPEPDAVEPEPVELTAEPEPDTTEPFEWDSERYTTAIEEPDWFAAEIVEPEQLISEATEEEPMADPAEADAAAPVVPSTSEPAGRGDEETMLWFGRSPDDAGGASEMEVATSGRRPLLARSEPEPGLPGSSDLDEALARLRALARRDDESAEPNAAPEQAADSVEAEPDEWPPRPLTVGEPARPPQPPQGIASGSATTTSSASRAYRRLRRIFPG